MWISSEKLKIISILIATGAIAVESKADLQTLIELRQSRYQLVSTELNWTKLQLHGNVWLPRTQQDINEYFRYHKDFEVRIFMQEFNKLLGVNLPEAVIARRSYFHDLPKVMKFSNLAKFGYKGWKRSIAENFLASLLDVDVRLIKKHLPGDSEYIKVDFSTRLLLSFGISQKNYKELFGSTSDQENILRELKDLPKDINQVEELVKKFYLTGYEKNLTDFERRTLNLLENLGDFNSRTQNMLARVEYGKIFITTSDSLAKDRILLTDYARQGISMGEALEVKNSGLSFVLKKLVNESGIDVVEKLGLDKIIETARRVEYHYISLVEKEKHNMPAHSRRMVDSYKRSVGKFASINLSLSRSAVKAACQVAFKNIKENQSK